jgi:DNA-directed RNA polymerase specialized sigma24 family protein
MGEDDRQLVIHCGLQGLSSEEAAERMGLKPATVAKRWQRCAPSCRRGVAGDLLAS